MIPADVRIFVCTEPVDMRRSFDGLALAARERLGQDPRQGGLFAFINRRANRLKILWFDRRGATSRRLLNVGSCAKMARSFCSSRRVSSDAGGRFVVGNTTTFTLSARAAGS